MSPHDDPSLRAWITLNLIRGIGGERIRALLSAFGSPEAVLNAPRTALLPLLKPAQADAIFAGIPEEALAHTLHWLETPGNQIVTLADADYPRALLTIPDPPPLLYVKGDIRLLNAPALAIVGSRNATPSGLKNAEAFSATFSHHGYAIVSGLAHGIDAAAHQGGLQGAGRSIAVVGTGLDRVYPAAHRALAHALAEHGAIVSEFPLGTPPLAGNFPRRNRIISGLGAAVLVVEASLRSGSLITARMALEQGRDVFAIPGSIHAPQSKGCHHLIKQGAKLVECAEDILEELGCVHTLTSDPLIPTSEASHAPLLELFGFDPISADTLATRSGLTMADLSAMLLSLELGGEIAVLPGGLYQRLQ